MSKLFTVNKDELKKVGIGALLGLLGMLASFLELNLFKVIEVNAGLLLILAPLNSGLVNLIRKFIRDEEGKYFGIKLYER